MPKQGKHHNDANDPDVARGHNNPAKSTPSTTGAPKRRETYEAQAREHRNTAKEAQHAKNELHQQTPRHLTRKDREGVSDRSGSDSNADRKSRGY